MPEPRSREASRYGPPVPSDEAPGSAPESAIAVHTLTSAAKDLIEGAFPPLWVRGEVSDFKAHRNGHWYFALRDADAQVKCVIWSSAAKRIPAPPDDGMQVLAYGQMTVWPVRGDLQFAVRALEAAGDGLWRKALERTRLSLEKDGLLDAARKRALPSFPRRIAVITSPDGAAMHDIITVARARSADVEIVIVAAKVQGEGAPESLVAAIERVGRWRDADVLIMVVGAVPAKIFGPLTTNVWRARLPGAPSPRSRRSVTRLTSRSVIWSRMSEPPPRRQPPSWRSRLVGSSWRGLRPLDSASPSPHGAARSVR